MTDDATYNLSAFAECLRHEGKKLELAGKIERAVHTRSVAVDLQHALEACRALETSLDNPTPQSEPFREVTEAALLSYLVVLYVRATKTRSDVRPSFDIRPHLTVGEKEIHAELCDLRDKAIAHFGPGGSYSGNWTIELAIMDVVSSDPRIAVVGRRLVADRALLGRAQRLIARALEIIGPIATKRINAATAALNAERAADPDFYKEIHKHPLNMEVFIGGSKQVDLMRAGRGSGGRAQGSFSHP